LRLIGWLAAWLWLAPAFAQVPAPGAPGEPVVAGRVELVEGDVRFFDRARQPRVPKVDDQILEGESIVTGADGEVHLRMEDGGLIAVRPGTKMRITNFRAQGDASDRLLVGLLEGSFRSVTGWIAKFTYRNYTVRTPTATIGVRGTDHEPFYIPEGSPLGEPGTYDRVHEGGTYIQTRHGRIEVDRGRAGFAHFRRPERPRLLDRVPDHFKPTRHDERIGKRYQEIQQRLEERREQRRKFLQERRDKLEQKRGAQRDKATERREALEKKRAERARQLEEKHKERRKDFEDKARERRKDADDRFRERRKDFEERRRERARERPEPKRRDRD